MTQDQRFAAVILAFMTLSALLTLEISHGLSHDRRPERLDGPVYLWMDLSLREPEPVGFSFSTGREPGCLQPSQEAPAEEVGAWPR